MKSTYSLAWSVVLALSTVCRGASESPLRPVGRDEAAQWIQSVIPLPREIAIERKIAATASRVAITLMPKASPLERAAAEELAGVLATDAHEGMVGDQPKNSYQLSLTTENPTHRCWIVADVQGAPVSNAGKAPGPLGHATIQRLRDAQCTAAPASK